MSSMVATFRNNPKIVRRVRSALNILTDAVAQARSRGGLTAAEKVSAVKRAVKDIGQLPANLATVFGA